MRPGLSLRDTHGKLGDGTLVVVRFPIGIQIMLFHTVSEKIASAIVRLLTKPSRAYEPFAPSDPEALRRTLRPADVLLVEGNQKVSTAIKYLTQSTWSHAALFVGDAPVAARSNVDLAMLVEMDLVEGCVVVPISKYENNTTRICRPVGLSEDDRRKVVQFMLDRLGFRYDIRNVIDLVRYLHPVPLVPVRWRRRMIALGSGEPTRAICSTLIAEAFQAVHYPILPLIDRVPNHERATSAYSREEILHIRHHSLYAPRDFDMSPYFEIVKPAIEAGFDYKNIRLV